jgi:predicted short-subunit dehydrogenase-like oxidoreductase (DUF2520 family)
VEIGFVGAGNVGFSLGKYFSQNNICVTGYHSRTPEHAQKAAEFTDTKAFDSLEALCSCSDALFLTVPDGELASVWDHIRMLPIQNKLICHCSGCLSSHVFSGIESTGAYGYSVHPLYAVSDRYTSFTELSKVWFTLEGSSVCLNSLRNMLSALGNPVKILDASSKRLYHAAAVFASNLVLPPLMQAAHLMVRSGFDPVDARKALTPLILGNAEAFCKDGGVSALTGPVERGDVKTVEDHKSVLTNEEWTLYTALTEMLLTIAA